MISSTKFVTYSNSIDLALEQYLFANIKTKADDEVSNQSSAKDMEVPYFYNNEQ